MFRSYRHIATSLYFCLVLLGAAHGLIAQGIATAPASNLHDGEVGVVLLDDAGVLEGTVSRDGKFYVVGRAGGQLQVATSRVQFIGRTLHDAYEFRRQQTVPTAAESHLTLADWCLRYKLVEEARTELELARLHDAEPRRLQLLERRLSAATERRPHKQPAPSQVIQASAIVEQAPPAAPTPDLPNGAVEIFTRKVQPILVNNCTTSKCHQPNGQQAFQLNRASLRGEANRKTTMRNLAAALALVDRQHPEQSQLLTIPRQTHGGMHAPTFGPRQDQAFRHLADWVALLAPPAPPAETQTNTTTEPATLLPSQTTALGPVPRLNEAAKPQTAATEPAPIESLRTPHRLRYGLKAERWQPKDPFDPEIFNRRQRADVQEQPMNDVLPDEPPNVTNDG